MQTNNPRRLKLPTCFTGFLKWNGKFPFAFTSFNKHKTSLLSEIRESFSQTKFTTWNIWDTDETGITTV